jgi:hypothetical protein
MKTIKSILVSTMALFLFQSCDKPKTDNTRSDMKLDSIKKDTINKIDRGGLKQGHWLVRDYDASGNNSLPIESGDYVNNKKNGTWHYYDSTGKINRTVLYKDDIPIKK